MITEKIIYGTEITKIVKAIKAVSTLEDHEDIMKDIIFKAIQKYSSGDFSYTADNKKPILRFTEKELNQMPKSFKKEFRADGCTAHIFLQKIGKRKVYRIQYRRNGYCIQISSKNLDNAKQKFIEALKTARPVDKKNTVPNILDDFTMYYYEKFRKKKVCAETYKKDVYRYKQYISPAFGFKKLKDVTPSDCQNLLDEVAATGKGRVVEDLKNNLSVIFKGAILHNLITNNPISIVQIDKHQREHGTALSKDEEKVLLTAFTNTKYIYSFALMLYAGLRPNEIKTARAEDKFIIAVNSKRKNGKIEYKKIPISPMLRPILERYPHVPAYDEMLRKKLKEVLPNHIPYDLRTMFYTRLKECNVADNAIKAFVGHSLGALGNTYTDLSDEYLLKEGTKYVY